MRLALLVCVLLTACSSGGLTGPSPAPDLASALDLGIAPRPPACTALDECSCLATPGCAAIAESCYCPFPQCNSQAACACGGGQYWGCAPAASHCPSLNCAPAQPLVDAGGGCLACGATATTCDAGLANLKATCHLSDAFLGGLRCDPNAACVLGCMQKLERCDQIGCAFCTTCDCAGSTPFTDCVAACQR